MYLTYAQTADATAAAHQFVDKLNQYFIFPIITLLMVAAMLLFVWGAFQYLYKADDPAARKTGSNHMLYGFIGLVVMVSALALLEIVVNTFFPGTAIPL